MARTGFLGTYTGYFDGMNRDSVALQEWPISSLTTVHDSLEQTFDATTEIDITTINFDPETDPLKAHNRIRRQYGLTFQRGFKNVKVVWTGGWATVPSIVEDVCIELAGMKYETRQTLTVGSSTQPDGSRSFVRRAELSDDMLQRLEPFIYGPL